MVSFLKSLVQDDYDVLEEIFTLKYRKFIEMYHILECYSSNIKSLSYKVTSKENLKIEIKVNEKDYDSILNAIKKSVKNKDNVEVTTEKKRIHIKITKDESNLP